MNFREAVALSVGALCEAFNRSPTDATFQAYEWGLAGLSAGDVQQATRDALQVCRFMPSPAELRELATSCGESVNDRALKAFAAVDRAVQSHGRNRTVDFDDPLINAAIRLCGGWLRFCDATLEQFDTWLRKEFIAAYSGLVRRPPTDAELCLPSPGQFLRENGFYHEHDKVRPVASGLAIGPVQRRLLEQRASIERADVPHVAFQSPNAEARQ